jgi:hypothetical protein
LIIRPGGHHRESGSRTAIIARTPARQTRHSGINGTTQPQTINLPMPWCRVAAMSISSDEQNGNGRQYFEVQFL